MYCEPTICHVKPRCAGISRNDLLAAFVKNFLANRVKSAGAAMNAIHTCLTQVSRLYLIAFSRDEIDQVWRPCRGLRFCFIAARSLAASTTHFLAPYRRESLYLLLRAAHLFSKNFIIARARREELAERAEWELSDFFV